MLHHLAQSVAKLSLASFAVALVACSGGTEDVTPSPPPPPPPPVGTIQLGFQNVTDNVVEPGSSQDLTANVTLGGNPAPDGTSVTFSISPSGLATTSPVAATTSSGSASTTLSTAAASPGASYVVKASASSNNNNASDSLTFYVRPRHQPMQVLVPIYPATGSGTGTGTGTGSDPWSVLATSAASYPDVKIIAIANPHAGSVTSTTTADATLSTAITAFKTVSGTNNKVLGYVATDSGSNSAISQADIEATIANYIRLYPNQLDGFYLDSMAADSAHLSQYQEIYGFIQATTTGLSSTPLVIGNPSTYPVSAYSQAADTLVTFSGGATAYQGTSPQPANTWVYARDNLAQAAMVHTAATCTEMQTAVQTADTPLMNTGMIYVTNMTSGAPWSALPAYWTQLLGTVDAINRRRPLPLC